MGIFSNSTEYKAYVASDALLEEKNFENTRKRMVLNACRSGDSIAGAIVGSNLLGWSHRIRRFIRYGIKKYPFPPPKTANFFYDFSEAELRTVLNDQVFPEPEDITILKAMLARPMLLVNAQYWLQQNWVDANNVPWRIGTKTYHVADPSGYFGSQVEMSGAPVVITDKSSATYEIWLHSVADDLDADGNYLGPAFKIKIATLPKPNNLDQYYYVWLTRVPTGSTLWLWVYRAKDGTYPTLVEYPGDELEDRFVPVIILMRDKVPYTAISAEVSKATEKLGDKINIDIEEFYEKFVELDTEKAEKTDIFLHFALEPGFSQVSGGNTPVLSNNNKDKTEYTFLFFDALRRGTFGNIYHPGINVWSIGSNYGIKIEIGGSNGFSETISCEDILHDFVEVSQPYVLDPNKLNFGTIDKEEYAYGSDVATNVILFPSYTYRWVTPYIAEVLAVYGFSTSYSVNTKKGIYTVYPKESDVVPSIPLHVGLLYELNASDREWVVQKSFRGTLFLVQKIKVKWYQKTFFKFLLVVIVVVLVVLAQQYQLINMLAGGLGIAAGTFAYTLLSTFVKMVIGFMISMASSFLGDVGWIFSLVVSIYLAGGFSQWMSGMWSNLTATGFGSAMQLLSTVTSVIQAGFNLYSQSVTAKLQEELADFTKSSAEKEEILEDAYYTLAGAPSYIEPLDIVRTRTMLSYNDGPEEFYRRTLDHDPGVNCTVIVEKFVEACLQLPKTKETINPATAMLADLRGV